MSGRRCRAAAASFVLAGCLPSGAPPAGRHLVHDRTPSGVFLSPSEQEGVPSHLLATGPLAPLDYPASYGHQALADVYAIDDSPAAAPIEGLVGIAPVLQAIEIPDADPTRYRFATDSLGRLLTLRAPPDAQMLQQSYFDLWRYDLGTDTGAVLVRLYLARSFMGGQLPFSLSPGRTRVFAGDDGWGWVMGPSRQQALWQVNAWAFIGEDFFFSGKVSASDAQVGSGSGIFRIKPDDDPQILLGSSGQLGFVTVVGDFTPQLLLSLSTEQGMSPFELLDTELLTSAPLPADKGSALFVSASPDGRFLLFASALPSLDATQPTEYRLFIYDWQGGRYASLDAGIVGKPIQGTTEWRPGTDELWLLTLPDGFATWRPGQGSTSFSGTPAQFAKATGEHTWFSVDGRYWFPQSSEGGSGPPTTFVGSADDPRGGRLRLNPTGTVVSGIWRSGGGGLLVEVSVTDRLRNDIFLVDPAARTTRALGSAGHLVAVGEARALALLDWQVARSSGRLTLIELANGTSTTLAEDVYALDVDRGFSASAPAADGLAPGTRVAYLSRNRLESRDDGLWVAELP